MAGHSKWANIKHKKAANDKKRGKLWSKLIKEDTVAAKQGGGDLDSNPRLRLAVDKAKTGNMPNDTIERAIKRGAGGEEQGNYDEIRYEGYAPGGIAIIVDCLTDNRNRTASEVRHAFTKHGGNLGTDGSVSYMFQKRGVISFSPNTSEEQIMEIALEVGVDDLILNDDKSIDLFTKPEDLQVIKDGFIKSGQEPENAEISFEPDTLSKVNKDEAEKVLRMIDHLEDLDDVQEVYTNIDIPEEVMVELEA